MGKVANNGKTMDYRIVTKTRSGKYDNGCNRIFGNRKEAWQKKAGECVKIKGMKHPSEVK